jgi:hypothetical protein
MDATWWFKVTAMATAAVLAGCSSGGGGSGGSGTPAPSQGVPPETFDLAFHGLHYHQDYYGNPQYYGIDFSVRNDSDWNPGTVAWSIRRRETGQVLSGTVPVGARANVGDGHNFHIEVFEAAGGDPSWIEPGRHTLEVRLDPANATREDADNLANNVHVLVIDVPGAPRTAQANDLRYFGREAHVHEALPDGRLVFHFQAENTGALPIEGATWRLRSSDVALPDEVFVIPSIPAGGRVETSAGINIRTPGTYVIEMILDPDDAVGTAQDADPDNNLRRFTIIMPADGAPIAPVAAG